LKSGGGPCGRDFGGKMGEFIEVRGESEGQALSLPQKSPEEKQTKLN